MFDKNISFWCVVLFFVVVMIIHHILSQNSIIEGNKNQDEDSGNIDMSNVKSFKFTIKGNSDAVIPLLGGNKKEKPTHDSPSVDNEAAGGSAGGAAGGAAGGSAGGAAGGSAGGAAGGEIPGSPAPPPSPPGSPSVPVGSPAPPPSPPGSPSVPVVSAQTVQPVDEGLYHYYPSVLQFEGVGDSTLGCKGNQGGGGESLSVQQAKDLCNTTEDCDGFFHYNTTGSDRTCFKKDIDISKDQQMTEQKHGENSGFYVVHGEKPEIIEPMWVLAKQKNQNCNEVCAAQEGNLKCLSGDWRMNKDEYKQILFDAGLKDEDSVNTVEDVETWCGKIGTSNSSIRPGIGNTPTNDTQCFRSTSNTTNCDSKHSIAKRLCKCGVGSNSS